MDQQDCIISPGDTPDHHCGSRPPVRSFVAHPSAFLGEQHHSDDDLTRRWKVLLARPIEVSYLPGKRCRRFHAGVIVARSTRPDRGRPTDWAAPDFPDG